MTEESGADLEPIIPLIDELISKMPDRASNYQLTYIFYRLMIAYTLPAELAALVAADAVSVYSNSIAGPDGDTIH
jgi:hypothetical protein